MTTTATATTARMHELGGELIDAGTHDPYVRVYKLRAELVRELGSLPDGELLDVHQSGNGREATTGAICAAAFAGREIADRIHGGRWTLGS